MLKIPPKIQPSPEQPHGQRCLNAAPSTTQIWLWNKEEGSRFHPQRQKWGEKVHFKALEEDPAPSKEVFKVHGPAQLRVSKLVPFAAALETRNELRKLGLKTQQRERLKATGEMSPCPAG